MRRFVVRDVNLLFPVAVLLVLSSLAILGWHRSIAVQRARDSSLMAADEYRLLDAMALKLHETETARRGYLASGQGHDLSAFRSDTLQLFSIAGRLEERAASDAVFGGRVSALLHLLDRRRAVLSQQVASRGDGGADGPQLEHDLPGEQYVHDRILATQQVLEGSHETRRRNVTGALRMLRWLAASVAALGVFGVLGVLRQLHRAWRRLSRAEAEQRLLALQLRGSLDSLSQGVAVFSADGLLLNWNMRLNQILALPAPLLRGGLSYGALERHLAASGEAFLEPLPVITVDAALGGNPSPVVYERVVRRPGADANAKPNTTRRAGRGGTEVEIRRTLMPQGGFVLTLTDMTERVQAEQMLHEAQKMQALGQLTGGIAHDFNNMLTVILGSLEVSGSELAAAGNQQVALLTTRMRRAAQAAESGAALTRQLLNFARRQPLTPVSVDLATVLPNLMPLLRHSIGETIALTFEGVAELWPAMVDAAQLESAVLNLALNARDAMPGGGKVTIEASNVVLPAQCPDLPEGLAPGDYVRISVVDTGHGMSREVIEQAFQPFFTTKPEGRGTGLGLAMVLAFARQCGGLATIQSEAGHGTRVSMHLPRALAAQRAATQHSAQHEADEVSASRRRPRVLVVEDDAAVREIAAETLREHGYRVSEAADAEEALRQLDGQAGGLDLLLTDLMLPGDIDGRGLAARVRQSAPAVPVLYMSGALESVPAADGGNEQATRWLVKPFRRAQLTALVGAMVKTRRSGQAA